MYNSEIAKKTPKYSGIAEEHFWQCMNSGGPSAPRAPATGDAWVHAPPEKTTGEICNGFLPSSLPSPVVKITVTYNKSKTHK
jgi:hypothetical protein